MNLEKVLTVIEDAVSVLHYNSESYTFVHKLCIYEAFRTVALTHPEKMNQYLIDLKKNVGLQNLIFQEYIKLLESKLPVVFIKNKKQQTINTLLDEDLSIFDGISFFDGFVNDKLIVKNNTQEMYIGGRTGTYAKPYWIGKLLDITTDNKSIIHNVVRYTFTQIELSNVEPGAKVQVAHLRVAPHYQMGGMVFINRIKKKIIEEIHN